jgi:uncharacterized damage-inducible protein DinB
MDLLDRMLEHDRWATTQLLIACRKLTDEQLDQEFDIGLRSIRATFDHVIYNIGFWTWVMAGKPEMPDQSGERANQTVPGLLDRFERAHANFAARSRQMRDEGRLSETVVDHYGGTPTLGGIAIHVVLHHEWHRNDIVHMLNRLDVDSPPEVDMALWDQTVQLAVTRIREERDRWHALAAEVGEDRMEEPGPMGEWTFKDLAGHLLGWRERTIARIEAGPDGNPPTPWPAELQTDDEINAWIYEQHRDRPLRDVLDDLDQTYSRLIRAIEMTPEGQLTSPGRFDWMGEQRLFEADFSGHLYEEHEPAIRAWLASR